MSTDYNVVTVNLDDTLYDNVNELAYNKRITRSDLIREALQTYIEQEVNKKMTVEDIYNLSSCYVEIRRGSITGQILYSEDFSVDSIEIIRKYGNREVNQLTVSDSGKLVIVIEK